MAQFFRFLVYFFIIGGSFYPLPVLASDCTADCIKNFNLDYIDFSDRASVAQSNMLKDYLICRAVSIGSETECSRIKSVSLDCKSFFGEVEAVFGRLIKNRDVEGAYSAARRYGVPGSDNPEFKLGLQGILSEDSSVCVRVPPNAKSFCLAATKGQPNLCTNTFDRDRVYYIIALRNKQVGVCDKISELPMRSACKASVLGNVSTCENDMGYKKFRESYCVNKCKNMEAR